MVLQIKFERFEHMKPPFTLSDLKKAVPPHCFKRSIPRSFAYVFRDLSLISLLYYIATNYISLLPTPLAALAWPLYWVCQGCVIFGIWIIGHECGHHSFSDYAWLDDTVGFIIHTTLLTPYFAWKISHRRHHLNTCSVEREEVYVPKLKSERIQHHVDNHGDSFLYHAFTIAVRLTIGWYLYIGLNMGGRKYDRFASHFLPSSPIFSDKERVLIMITDVGIVASVYAIYTLTTLYGAAWVMCICGVPFLVANMFLVLTTNLQHTHVGVPHYDATEWDWLRGALATVDRDYGFILNSVFHHLVDTHVVHHLFSHLPHYHAVEATKAVKPILGKYYNYDDTPILKALWRDSQYCVYIAADEDDKNKGVYWFNKH